MRTRAYMPPRRRVHNPLFRACPLHLQRICGVCAHFDGASMRADGGCAKHGTARNGRTDARDCDDWRRKTKEERGHEE